MAYELVEFDPFDFHGRCALTLTLSRLAGEGDPLTFAAILHRLDRSCDDHGVALSEVIEGVFVDFDAQARFVGDGHVAVGLFEDRIRKRCPDGMRCLVELGYRLVDVRLFGMRGWRLRDGCERVEYGREANGGVPKVRHETDVAGGAIEGDAGMDLDHIRGDLEEVNDAIERTLDAAQAEAVAALHDSGRRTPRGNLGDLMDEGSFREFGPPAAGSAYGGTIMGFGSVNAELVGEERSRVAVVHSNYRVASYTHGHYRQEQVHELVHDWRSSPFTRSRIASSRQCCAN